MWVAFLALEITNSSYQNIRKGEMPKFTKRIRQISSGDRHLIKRIRCRGKITNGMLFL
jgi:hypothetical protein